MDNFKFPEPGEIDKSSDSSDTDILDISIEDILSQTGDDINFDEFEITNDNSQIHQNIIDISTQNSDSLIGSYEEDEITTEDVSQFLSNSLHSSESNRTDDVIEPEPVNIHDRIINDTPQSNTNTSETNTSIEPELSSTQSDEDTDLVLPKNIKYILFGVVGFCIILILIKTVNIDFSNMFKSTKDVSSVTYVNNTSRFKMDSISGTKDIYSDYMIIDKEIVIDSGNLLVVVNGTTTKNKIDMQIPLTTEEYNNYTDGQILEVTYNLTKVNGELYPCNIKVKGVIAG